MNPTPTPPPTTDKGYPRILVLRGGAIGDFIATLPAIRALREQWPRAHIELIGYPHIAGLAQAAGLVNRVRSLDSADIARLFAHHPGLDPAALHYFQSFHVAVSYLYDPEGRVKTNLTEIGIRTVLYGSPLVTEQHAVPTLFKPLESLAIYPGADEMPRLRLPPTHIERGRTRITALGADPLAIHPGSGSPAKNWPLDHFLQVERHLRDQTGQRAFFILGEADQALADALHARKCDIPVLKNCTLLETAETLAACHRYLGNDSGITHIAAALGIRTTALYGPSNPAHWGVLGTHTRRITAAEPTSQALSDIPADTVTRLFLEP